MKIPWDFHANLGNGIFMGFPYDLTNQTWDYPEADVVRINWFVLVVSNPL
jgi:hypothetical protein